MTTQTTVRQEKRGVGGVLAMTAATVALVGGVVLWQFRPTGDSAVPTAATHSRESGGLTPMGGQAERFLEESRAQRSDAGAGTGSVAPVTVDTLGGMAELYREQQAAPGDHRTDSDDRLGDRVACGDGPQPALCY